MFPTSGSKPSSDGGTSDEHREAAPLAKMTPDAGCAKDGPSRPPSENATTARARSSTASLSERYAELRASGLLCGR